VVVLEPPVWVGQQLPLLAHIDIGRELAKGSWTVLLYRRDCPRCHEVIPNYLSLAEELAKDPEAPRVALVEVSVSQAHTTEDIALSSPYAKVGYLDDSNRWFVQVPVALALHEGIVLEASAKLPGFP
jgi:hypothetical protein